MTKNIRNFTIIAHIDHGKSTLSDRIIEKCSNMRNFTDRVLDSMDLEKEKGITIKSQTVRLEYKSKNGKNYILNLMDTPGHVDFSYEVGRCISACEGSILLVDATQGVEAQTLANAYKAIENNHNIIVALNKVDLISADIDSCKKQIEEIIGLNTDDAIMVSGKTGQGVNELLEKVVNSIPAANTDKINSPLKALLIDSWYDKYRGVIIMVRVYEGILTTNQDLFTISNKITFKPEEIGFLCINRIPSDSIRPGEVGYIISNIEQTDCNIGDTITYKQNQCEALPGLKKLSAVVFCSIFPENGEFEKLKYCLEKLKLNDGFTFHQYHSSALGMGFRCGFLGLLHLEIILERIRREFSIEIIPTVSSVEYKAHTNKEIIKINSPNDLPSNILYIEEPYVQATMILPNEYLGNVMKLALEHRGEQVSIKYINTRVMLIYNIPLNEIVVDFYDKLKSATSGYASFEYEFYEYRKSDIVVLNIMLNGNIVDPLSSFIHRSSSLKFGQQLCSKLKSFLSRQMFEIKIQAAIGVKIICSERLSPFRKNVTAKLYGGDVTRKNKLLDKQKKGKKKMKSTGSVQIPGSVLIKMFKK